MASTRGEGGVEEGNALAGTFAECLDDEVLRVLRGPYAGVMQASSNI